VDEKYCRAGQATDDNIMRRMRIACWMNKATDTYLEYVIIGAFPRRYWSRERSLMIRCTYNVSVVLYNSFFRNFHVPISD
jgi:hypothetical protein